MSELGEAASADAIATMREFLRSGPVACSFARTIARARRGIQWGAFPGSAPAEALTRSLDAVFDVAAEAKLASVAVFPDLRSAEDITALVESLAATSRWVVRLPTWRRHQRDDALVGLYWRTPKSRLSSVMGFAPLGSMPVFRRAPYVALGLWTGERENPKSLELMKRVKRADDEVGFVDMPVRAAATQERVWDATLAEVKRVRDLQREGAAEPDVTFCLPQSCRERVAGLLHPPPKAPLPTDAPQ